MGPLLSPALQFVIREECECVFCLDKKENKMLFGIFVVLKKN